MDRNYNEDTDEEEDEEEEEEDEDSEEEDEDDEDDKDYKAIGHSCEYPWETLSFCFIREGSPCCEPIKVRKHMFCTSRFH